MERLLFENGRKMGDQVKFEGFGVIWRHPSGSTYLAVFPTEERAKSFADTAPMHFSQAMRITPMDKLLERCLASSSE